MEFERIGKSRRPVIYALAAFVIAAATIGGLELAGNGLTSAHSGLGGKLSAPSVVAPARVPLR